MTSPHEIVSRTPDLPVSVASPQPILGVATDDEPALHPFIERLWRKLPQAYRVMDSRQGYTLKRMLAGLADESGKIDTILAELWGARPIGPGAPSPWPEGMSTDELRRWRNARRAIPSALGDPYSARPEWLPWLAQHVGVVLDPAATVQEQRDMIRYGTSGWHAGTEGSTANAARSALTGSRFSRVIRGWRPDVRETGIQPTMWDLTVVTRISETPDPDAVLRTIARKGCKPAGAVLHHKAYEAPWKVIEALRPTWTDWERTRSADNSFHHTTWTELEETGLSFADVPGQLWRNASFENGVAFWVATGGSIEPVVGGIDSFGAARLTAQGSVSAAYDRVNLTPSPTLDDTIGDWKLLTPRSGIVKASILDLSNTIRAAQGTRYGRFILTGNASSSPNIGDAGVYQSTYMPVTPNTAYRATGKACSSGGRTGYAYPIVYWYTADKTYISASTPGVGTQLAEADSWTTVGAQVTSPATAAFALQGMQFSSVEPGVDRTMRFDAMHFERASTYDGTFIIGTVNVPAQTPGIDVTQDPVRANYHEDYRAALNVFPIDASCSVRVRVQFYDSAGTLVDTQIERLGSFAPGPWKRTPSARFRTNAFASTMRATMQFRDMQPGQVVDIDACELRAFVGGV